MNLSDWIDRHADFTPARTAIRCNDVHLTYWEMANDVSRLAYALKNNLEVSRGDRVALIAQNTVQSLVLAFACARIGAIYQPLNWRQAAPEHVYALNDSSPKALFIANNFSDLVMDIVDDIPKMFFVALEDGGPEDWPSCRRLIKDASCGLAVDPAITLDDSFLLCYTSGTTGRPKGAVLSQNAIFYNAANSRHMHNLRRDDEVMVPIPLFHVGGMNILATPALHAGAGVHLMSTFDVDETFDILEKNRITLTVLVPAQLKAMLASPRWQSADLTRLRCISTGSTMVPTAMIGEIHEKGIPVIQVYGSTETTPLATYLTVETADEGMGSGGKTGLHCQVRVVDENDEVLEAGKSGEVLVKGPNVLKEYWNNPEATARFLKDGWFYTGDIGHFDDKGYLFIDDRKKDMIISGSENIYPAMLENILSDCPGVKEASVVGRPDEKWGEAVVAVVAKENGAELDKNAVIGHFDGRIGRFAMPQDVMFVESLPRNAMGKVVKDEVRATVNEMINNNNDDVGGCAS